MTRKLLFYALALLTCIGAKAQGVDFRPLSFSDALAVAKVEGKPLLLDCYTDWCQPCKMMDREVFSTPEAGEYFNSRFVCIKINMEQGEGVDLSRRFMVVSYPTYIVFDGSGKELHRVLGANNNLNEFTKRIEAGLGSGKSPEELDREFEAGTISAKDLESYWYYLKGGSDKKRVKAVGDRLYEMLPVAEKVKPEYWTLVSERAWPADGDGFKFVLDNRKALSESNGRDVVDNLIFITFEGVLHRYLVNTFDQLTPEMRVALPVIRQRLDATEITLDGAREDEYMQAIAQLAAARVTGDIDLYFDTFDRNVLALKSGQPIIHGIIGSLEMIGGRKPYYARLSRIGAKALPLMKDEGSIAYFESIRNSYDRMSKVGVQWEQLPTFGDAVAQGAREGKNLFIFFYSPDSPESVRMLDDVLTQEAMGDFFNNRGVNYKVDISTPEGAEIAKHYSITVSPTILVIDPAGQMRHMVVGTGEGQPFIDRVIETYYDEKALGPKFVKFNEGNRNREFLTDLVNTLRNNQDPRAEVVARALSETE